LNRSLTFWLGWLWSTLIRTRKKEMKARVKGCLNLSEEDSTVLVREVYHQMAASLIEVLTGRTSGRLLATTIIEGWAHLVNLHGRRGGFVVVTAHTGNWELLTHLDTLCGIDGGFVSKRFNVGVFQRLLSWTRRRSLDVYDDVGSARVLLRRLQAGDSVGFAVDQHSNEAAALPLEFLGDSAWWSTAPARIARLAKVPIVPIRTYRRDGHHVIEIHHPLIYQWTDSRQSDIREVTEWYASVVENWVKDKPEQWLWLHRRWKPRRESVVRKVGS
jgi:Kdo2-lipid IVA lauroyltransferase/acyltransferase